MCDAVRQAYVKTIVQAFVVPALAKNARPAPSATSGQALSNRVREGVEWERGTRRFRMEKRLMARRWATRPTRIYPIGEDLKSCQGLVPLLLGEQILTLIVLPPIMASVVWLLSRGWAGGVQGGTISETTKQRQKLLFWFLVIFLYALAIAIYGYSWLTG
jgi:hypothetical protein